MLEDAETGEQLSVDTHDRAFRARFLSLAAERQRRLERTFAQNGVGLLSLSTDADVLPALVRFALLRKQTRRRTPEARLGAAPSAALPPAGTADGSGTDRSPEPMLRPESRGRELPA